MSIYHYTNYKSIDIDSYIESSNIQLQAMFSSISINESYSRAFTEASVKELISKVKEFFKKIFTKFIEILRSKIIAIKSRFKPFYVLVSTNTGYIDIAKEAIKRGKIVINKEYQLFINLDLDNTVSSISAYLDDAMNITKFKIEYSDLANMDDYFKGKIDSEELKSKVNKTLQMTNIIHDFVKSLDIKGIKLSPAEAVDFEPIKKAIIEDMQKLEPINSSNIERLSEQFLRIQINANEFDKLVDNYRARITRDYNNAIASLDKIGDAKNFSDAPEDRISVVVNLYSSIFKNMLDFNMNILNFSLTLRDKQISTYYDVATKLIAIGKKYAKAHNIDMREYLEGKYKWSDEVTNESSGIFESVRFI